MNPTNKNSGDELADNQFMPGMSPEIEQFEIKTTKEQNLVGMSPTPLTMLTNNTTSNVNFADKDYPFPATDVCSRRVGVPTQLDNNSTEDLVMSEEEEETASATPIDLDQIFFGTVGSLNALLGSLNKVTNKNNI